MSYRQRSDKIAIKEEPAYTANSEEIYVSENRNNQRTRFKGYSDGAWSGYGRRQMSKLDEAQFRNTGFQRGKREMATIDDVVQVKLLAGMEKLFSSGMEVS